MLIAFQRDYVQNLQIINFLHYSKFVLLTNILLHFLGIMHFNFTKIADYLVQDQVTP